MPDLASEPPASDAPEGGAPSWDQEPYHYLDRSRGVALVLGPRAPPPVARSGKRRRHDHVGQPADGIDTVEYPASEAQPALEAVGQTLLDEH